MIFNKRQLMTFKQVRERTWYAQNRLREPYIKQFTGRLKNYFNNFINEEVSNLLSPLLIKSK